YWSRSYRSHRDRRRLLRSLSRSPVPGDRVRADETTGYAPPSYVALGTIRSARNCTEIRSQYSRKAARAFSDAERAVWRERRLQIAADKTAGWLSQVT